MSQRWNGPRALDYARCGLFTQVCYQRTALALAHLGSKDCENTNFSVGLLQGNQGIHSLADNVVAGGENERPGDAVLQQEVPAVRDIHDGHSADSEVTSFSNETSPSSEEYRMDPQLIDRAQGGDCEAQYQLASRYYEGLDVSQDFTAAAEWFKRAALQGHARAQFNLGYMCEFGKGVDEDLTAATKWYTLSAELGLAAAQNNLAWLYERNEQLESAAHWYQRAADQGDMRSQSSLGFAFSKGRGVPVDLVRAVYYYRLGAEQGYAPAQYNLGGMCAGGRGTPLDAAAAVRWVRLAADQEYAPAQGTLGTFYAKGFGVPADSTEAMRWFLRGAVQGEPEAQNNLAINFSTGDGVREDQLRAFMWFAAAASNGNRDAVQNLDLVPVDRNSDMCRLISAASAADPDAQRELAIKLYRGEGIQQDAEASSYWLRRAAESGDPWSQTTYALQLKRSDNPQVEIERVRWLSRAAEQGDACARFNLGLKQSVGEGTAVDLESGGANLLRASLAGFEGAREFIEKNRSPVFDAIWPSIVERLKWPDLIFIVGPLVEGHLDSIRVSQENDDGSDDAEWLSYDRKVANVFFGPADRKDSLLDAAFGERVIIKQFQVGRTRVSGKVHGAVTINLQNIHTADGCPVFWKPSKEGLDFVAHKVGLIGGRVWVRWLYLNLDG